MIKLLALILMIAGVLVLRRGLRMEEDENTMEGLKFRMVLTGGFTIFVGLIILLR
jgi:hypothetical protein